MKAGTVPSQTRRIGSFARYVVKLAGRRRLALGLGFLILGTVTESLSILMLIPVLHMVGEDASTIVVPVPEMLRPVFGGELTLSLLAVLAVLVSVVVAQALFARFKNIYMGELLYDVVNRIRTSLFESIGGAKWQFIGRMRGSDILHAVTADIERIHNASFRLLLLTQGLVVLAGYFVVSWLVSPAVTLFAFVTGGLVLAFLRPIRRRAGAYGKLLTENRQEQARIVHEFLSGIRVAKSFNAEPRYIAELAATLQRVREDFGRYIRVNSISGLAFQIASAIVLVTFVYTSLTYFSLSLPQLIVLVFVFMRILPRFTALQSDVQEMLVNLPAFDALNALREACEREREAEPPPGRAPPRLEREMRFSDVSFRYSTDGDSVLKGASFVIPARQITAIIGPSGSGKSTLADMLMGLIEPDTGEISVDGLDLHGENRRSWRGEVAYVPQEVFLLHDTIEANFRLAAPDVSESAIWAALESAQARSFVEQLPEGLKTVVGDRGTRLSGGERQRIALARALLRRPQVIILDEATSALDWENQAHIARAMETLRGSVTIVTIAHRLSMIAFADWVVALEAGRIVETGAYGELINRPDSRLSRMVAGEAGQPPPLRLVKG